MIVMSINYTAKDTKETGCLSKMILTKKKLTNGLKFLRNQLLYFNSLWVNEKKAVNIRVK